MQNVVSTAAHPRALEFGIYRDGDNNLDDSQAEVLNQAYEVSATDSSIQFTVEDSGHPIDAAATLDYTIADGKQSVPIEDKIKDMADPRTLAQFVKRTLDNAERTGAKQTWIELVDHGAGDGGGLEADTYGGIMPMPQIAAAIAKGVELHAKAHPEDANRHIDGVAANQCLMSTLGFADALASAGVKYLAASPETMVSPGVPSNVAHEIAAHIDDPSAMAKGVVNDVMHQRYGVAPQTWGPAAAFDVLDLDKAKIANAEHAIKAFNDELGPKLSATERAALREDTNATPGMVRFHQATKDMPWHADRPAIALYEQFANDGRLNASLRNAAAAAAEAVSSLVLAHRESPSFKPFDGASYKDATGPTIHAPIDAAQVDPWAPNVSETDNSFYRKVDEANFTHTIA